MNRRRRMRTYRRFYGACCVLGLVLCGPPALAGTIGPGEAGRCFSADLTRTVVSGDEIEHSGAIRLADVLQLLPSWHRTSVEGFLWNAAPGIYAVPEWDGLSLMVDGQPLNISILGQNYLNAYPLDVGLIDSLEVFEGPVVCNGVWAPSGLISIHTRREKRYVSVGGSGAVGNETGDPGPFRYLEEEPINIDRSGPAGAGFAAIAGSRWHARVALKGDEHHVTDVRLRPRVTRLFKALSPPRHFYHGRRGDIKVDLPRANLSLTIDEADHEHFRFIEPVGSEVPLTLTWTRGGGFGRAPLYGAASLFFSGEYALLRMSPNSFTPEIEFDWQERRGEVHAGVSVDLPQGSFQSGFSAHDTHARGERRMVEPDVASQAWYFSVQAAPHPRTIVAALGRIEREDGRARRSGVLRATWLPLADQRLHLAVSSTAMPLHETANLYFWMDRGLTAPTIPGLDLGLSLTDAVARRTTISAAWEWSPLPAVHLSATGTVARFDHFPLADHRLSFETGVNGFLDSLKYFETQTTILPDVAGETARLAFDATVRPFEYLVARFYYAQTVVRSGAPAFQDAWAVVPEHRAFASITFSPLDRVSVQARMRIESESVWPDYRSVERPSGGDYPSRLPDVRLLDLAFTKRFWYDHIRASALIMNVLNRHLQHHPAGGSESLTLLARLQIQF